MVTGITTIGSIMLAYFKLKSMAQEGKQEAKGKDDLNNAQFSMMNSVVDILHGQDKDMRVVGKKIDQIHQSVDKLLDRSDREGGRN